MQRETCLPEPVGSTRPICASKIDLSNQKTTMQRFFGGKGQFEMVSGFLCELLAKITCASEKTEVWPFSISKKDEGPLRTMSIKFGSGCIFQFSVMPSLGWKFWFLLRNSSCEKQLMGQAALFWPVGISLFWKILTCGAGFFFFVLKNHNVKKKAFRSKHQANFWVPVWVSNARR